MKFVLVHGAWHDGPTWKQTISELERLGHEAVAPTIKGHGKDVSKELNHRDSVKSIVDFIVDGNFHDFVFVGHSFGGSIIAKVAELIPERIRRLVFWNAFIPKDGNSVIDELPPSYQEMFANLARQSQDGSVQMPWMVWRDSFMNDADEDLARQTYDLLSSEPYQPMADKLDLKNFYSLDLPKSFLNCTEDTALPPGEFGWHPRMSARLGHYRLVQMPGGHEVLFTNPTGLAAKLIEAGRD